MLESQFVLPVPFSAKLAAQPPTVPAASLKTIESLTTVSVFALLDISKLSILMDPLPAQNATPAATLAHFWPPNVPTVTEPPTVSWDMTLSVTKSATVSVDTQETPKETVSNQTVLLT